MENTPPPSPETDTPDSIPPHYAVPEAASLAGLVDRVEHLRQEYTRLLQLHPDLQPVLQEKLRAVWTYHSNAIEGSRLSEGDTIFFLKEGLTVKGKPFKDFLDAKNHAEAIDFLREVVVDEREISEGLMKDINALLLRGVDRMAAIDHQGNPVEKPATPGQYKKHPNHVLQSDGTIHHYVAPLQVQGEMQALVQWVRAQERQLHPVIIAAVAHYNMVRIHPFDDGNGRGARILMNLILMRSGYPPAIIKMEDRQDYLEAIREVDRNDLEPIVRFVAGSLVETLEQILADLKGAP